VGAGRLEMSSLFSNRQIDDPNASKRLVSHRYLITTSWPTHFYSNIRRSVSTMPTLRLVHLTEQQYAVMTDHVHAGAANNTTAKEEVEAL
jgi:hypothetical protein